MSGYRQVCTGTTGHAEAVQITFNPELISFRGLLEVFFASHDPTTRNRQGNDVGTQYRSAIFYHSAEQQQIAQQMVAEIDAASDWSNHVVTEIAAAGMFYPAEDYHQDYFANNARQPYCQLVVAPKVAGYGINSPAKSTLVEPLTAPEDQAHDNVHGDHHPYCDPESVRILQQGMTRFMLGPAISVAGMNSMATVRARTPC